ncbi:MAG: translation initiation factor IF-3 [Planctomycetia bacterium]|nr:translation initiation factor IF-3 [Planctomycetia bacterium]
MNLRRTPGNEGKFQQRINEQIRVREVRVIAEDGTQLGVMPTLKALTRAHEAELDLVEVAPNEKPPVCRIMDYGKFKYQMTKKQSKANPHQIKVKEIRLRPGTGEHDVITKVNNARGFLEKKDKVIVSIMFRGRELAHIQEGEKMMRQVIELLSSVAKVEAAPSRQGKRIICTLAPN